MRAGFGPGVAREGGGLRGRGRPRPSRRWRGEGAPGTHPAPLGRLSAAAREGAASPPSRRGSSPGPATRTCSWCGCPARGPRAAAAAAAAAAVTAAAAAWP